MRGPMGGGQGVAPDQQVRNFGASVRRLLGSMRAELPRLIGIIALALAGVTLQVIGPSLLGRATDVIFNGVVGTMLPTGVSHDAAVAALRARGEEQLADMIAGMDVVPGTGIDFDRLATILLLALSVYLAAAMLLWIQGRLVAGVVQRTAFALRRDVQAKIDRMPLSEIDSRTRGDLLSRVTNDIDNLAQSLQQTMSQLITSVATIIGVLVMMFVLSWHLALIAVVTVPVTGWATMMIAKRAQPHFQRQWRATGELGGRVEEAFTGHELATAFNAQGRLREEFDEVNEELFRTSFRSQFISGTIMPMTMFLGNLNYVLIAVVGGLRVASGQLSLGSVQAFIQYSRQFSHPLGQLASMAGLVQSGVASAERVFDVLDAREEAPDPIAEGATSALQASSRVRGEVIFDDVHFRYVPDEPLISGLDLHVKPGQTVAIVGPTGAGKTTLVNLLERFYEIDSGRILLDGVDIRDMPRHELRSHFGMVLQDSWLFQGTIAENIAFGRAGASMDDVQAAARAAGVERFVHSLPEGYDTVIDEEGGGVSAGEKQLITIARAFLADRALLILDEATSSVDTRTEVLVQEAMNRLRRGRTSFVIAHRLSTIRGADVILVMSQGAIVERGTHEELLAADGIYAELYASQFSGAGAGA